MCLAASYDALVRLPVFQALKAFCLAAMAFFTCSFHHQFSRRQWWGRVVPHTSSVVLSRPVLMLFQISSVAASATPALTCELRTPWKWLLVWGSLSFQTLRSGWTCAWVLVAHLSSCRIQEADVAGLLPRRGSVLLLWQVYGWSCWKGWSLPVWLHFPTCTWWVGCRVSWNLFPRSRLNARAYSRVLSPSVVLACHTPSHHALPCILCLHGLHGRSNLHMGSEIRILGSWQSQHAADQRTGPQPHHRPLCGAFSDRKVTTCWPTISFTKMILSEALCTTKTFSILFCYKHSYTSCACRFLTSRASTWCSCPWLCGSCHHGIWSPGHSRHPLSCGLVFPLPHKLFLSECSHSVFTPWISSGACLIGHNGPTLRPTPDRRPSRRCYQQNFYVCWYRLTLILLLWLP